MGAKKVLVQGPPCGVFVSTDDNNFDPTAQPSDKNGLCREYDFAYIHPRISSGSMIGIVRHPFPSRNDLDIKSMKNILEKGRALTPGTAHRQEEQTIDNRSIASPPALLQ